MRQDEDADEDGASGVSLIKVIVRRRQTIVTESVSCKGTHHHVD